MSCRGTETAKEKHQKFKKWPVLIGRTNISGKANVVLVPSPCCFLLDPISLSLQSIKGDTPEKMHICLSQIIYSANVSQASSVLITNKHIST